MSRLSLSLLSLLLLPLAVASTVYLYLYPIFHGCAFPLPHTSDDDNDISSSRFSLSSISATVTAVLNTYQQHVHPEEQKEHEPAIFRLLVLADPQLEGDSSLPRKEEELIPRAREHWRNVWDLIAGVSSSSSSLNSSISNTTTSNTTVEYYSNTTHWTWTWTTPLKTATTALLELTTTDLPRTLRGYQKRLDLLGNDFYLAHIYRTLHWWSRPTHVTVLGDLIGSQWTSDEEFGRRASRFWGRVFRGAEDGSAFYKGDGNGDDDVFDLNPSGDGDGEWSRRLINVAGNHDIGYAGDISEARISRFERVFGRTNWDVRFRLPPSHYQHEDENTPSIHLINLNSLTLDTPALSNEIQSDSYAYINNVMNRRSRPVGDRSSFTLLLTHLPLHKEEGVCTDGPDFSFHEEDDDDEDGDEVEVEDSNSNNNENDQTPEKGTKQKQKQKRYYKDGLKDQNHLSQHVSAMGVLEGIFGMSGDPDAPAGGVGRNGLVLTGHDHSGCDVVHFVERGRVGGNGDGDGEEESWRWNAKRYSHFRTHTHSNSKDTPSLHEITLRSMMGEFNGNAGLLSIWFDNSTTTTTTTTTTTETENENDNDNDNQGEWKYAFTTCQAGVQHIWWAVHGVDVAALGVLIGWVCLGFGLVVLRILRALGWFWGEGAKLKTESESESKSQSQSKSKSKSKVNGNVNGGLGVGTNGHGNGVGKKKSSSPVPEKQRRGDCH